MGILIQLIAVCSFLALFTPSESVDPYIWHVTDMHFDPTYHGSRESCKDGVSNPGKYGDYECDAPYQLLTSSIRAMAQFGRGPTFIIYTGDSPFHVQHDSTSELDTEHIIEIMENITSLFKNTFYDIPIIMTLGNHDYYPLDQLPGNPNPLYDEMAELWSQWLTPEAVVTFKQGAYYTLALNNTGSMKLRVVVLNTNLYLTSNDATSGETDPAGQFAWLENVLQAARTVVELVHLVGHVPSGVMPAPDLPMWMRESHNTRINEIIREYSDVIVGYYSCHEHLDSFRLFYKDDKPVVALYVAPSIAPKRVDLPEVDYAPAHNPGVRKIIYDQYDGYMKNIEQYYLDLPKANQDKADDWTRLYTFNGLYGVHNITPAALHELVERFGIYGSPEFHKFHDMSTVGSRHSSIKPCGCDCKVLTLCSIRHVDYGAFDSCYAADQVTCTATVPRISLALIIGLIVGTWKSCC